MHTAIRGLGTATPPHRMSQEESLQMFSDIVCSDEKQKRLARVLFRKSEVLNRHTCVPHRVAYNWCQPPGQTANLPVRDLTVPPSSLPAVQGGQSHGPSTLERMQLYAMFASELALAASRRALENARVAAEKITHLVTVSCTGFDAPGVDINLIKGLGLPNTTQRVHVGFMGCHGAINGLRTARGIASSDRRATVLLCAVELCSLHYRFNWDSEGIIGNALFADGSAAVVLGQPEPGAEKTLPKGWQLLDTGSLVIADSEQAMSWRVGDHGFEMLLTSEVGDRIEAGLAAWLTGWLAQHDLTLADIDHWGVHPGGPRILSAVQNSLQLAPEALAVSKSVLAQHGNMSSPTVLFILHAFAESTAGQARNADQHCLLLAFGPGLVAEAALLKRTAG